MNLSMATQTVAMTPSTSKTLSNTFKVVAGMWLVTAVTGFMVKDVQMSFGGAMLLLLLLFAAMFGVYKTRNSAAGLGFLALFSALFGFSVGPAVGKMLAVPAGASIVALAAFMTAAATAGCAVYASVSRRSFSFMRGYLFAGLIVLLIGSVAGLFIQSTPFHLAISSVSALLFTAFLLLDVSDVVTGEQTNYILAAMNIYLDMLNLFMSLLRVFGILSADD